MSDVVGRERRPLKSSPAEAFCCRRPSTEPRGRVASAPQELAGSCALFCVQGSNGVHGNPGPHPLASPDKV